MPKADIESTQQKVGIVFFGTTTLPMREALDRLEEQGIQLDTMRLRAFPFGAEVWEVLAEHDFVFLVEQNRDAQMKSLLVNEGGLDPADIVSILYFAGLSISADFIAESVANYFRETSRPMLTEVSS